MNWKDPIVEEVRKVREELTKEYSFDLKKMGSEFKKWEKKGWPVVTKNDLANQIREPFQADEKIIFVQED